jgi:hypothetical protein
MHAEFWWGDLMEGDNLEDLGVDWKIILKMDNRKAGGWRIGMDCCDSERRQVTGTCECGYEHSDSIKCGEFVDWLSFSGRTCFLALVG